MKNIDKIKVMELEDLAIFLDVNQGFGLCRICSYKDTENCQKGCCVYGAIEGLKKEWYQIIQQMNTYEIAELFDGFAMCNQCVCSDGDRCTTEFHCVEGIRKWLQLEVE